jgi:hypothetical protein
MSQARAPKPLAGTPSWSKKVANQRPTAEPQRPTGFVIAAGSTTAHPGPTRIAAGATASHPGGSNLFGSSRPLA